MPAISQSNRVENAIVLHSPMQYIFIFQGYVLTVGRHLETVDQFWCIQDYIIV